MHTFIAKEKQITVSFLPFSFTFLIIHDDYRFVYFPYFFFLRLKCQGHHHIVYSVWGTHFPDDNEGIDVGFFYPVNLVLLILLPFLFLYESHSSIIYLGPFTWIMDRRETFKRRRCVRRTDKSWSTLSISGLLWFLYIDVLQKFSWVSDRSFFDIVIKLITFQKGLFVQEARL